MVGCSQGVIKVRRDPQGASRGTVWAKITLSSAAPQPRFYGTNASF